jgi:ubiquinone/menaquinone biosynthesis C-methylase UbiE
LQSLENGRLGCAGVDISAVALRHMQRQCVGEQGHLIQMDATALALLNDAYDIVFAFGVVAYTSDQQRCFAELCRVCKPGGWIGVWIYPQQEGLGGLTFGFVRRVCQRVGPFWTRRIADLIVPFLGILPTRSKMSLRNSTWRQCREVVLVNIAPKQLAFFCRDEVVAWFVAHGIDIEYEDRDNPITIWGRKQR